MDAKRLSPLRLSLVFVAALAAWVSAGALSVASSQPRAPRIGVLPPPGWLAVCVATLGAVVLTWWPRRPRVVVLALSTLLLLPWLPVPIPAAFLVWVGPLRVWLWIILVAAFAVPAATGAWGRVPRATRAAAIDPRRARWLAAVVASIGYVTGAYQVSPQLPAGDEPHYLVIAESLITDHDLLVENNYRRRDYNAYFAADLRPDFLRRGTDGEIYSIHAPGLPVLVAPVFAVFGYRGVLLFLALVAGWASALAWIAAWRVTRDIASAWFGWATVALSLPFFFQAFVVYPDAPGAAIVMLGVLTLIETDERAASLRRLAATGLALAILPWLHARLAIASGVLGALILLRQLGAPVWPRRAVALLAVPMCSAVCWLGFFYAIYRIPDPRAPYGGSSQSSLSNLPRGLIGLAFDQQFGVLPNAPVYLCAALGFIPLLRRHTRLAVELLAVIVPYTLSVGAFQMWWAGSSSAARFLTPMLLLLAVPAAAWFQASRGRASRMLGLGGLAVSLLVTATIAAVDRGALLYNVRDGHSRLLGWLSPLVDLTTGVPSLFQNEPFTALVQGAIWLAALTLTAVAGAFLARRGASTGASATGIGFAAALTAMLALSIVWRTNGAMPLTPTAGNVALLDLLDPGNHQIAVQYGPLKRVPLGDVPARLTLASAAPGSAAAASQINDPLMWVLHPPTATYAVEVALSHPGAGRVSVTADHTFGPAWTWDLTGARGFWRREFRLPIATPAMLVDGDAAARPTIERLTLRALDVTPPRDRVSNLDAWHVARYGPAVVFLIAGDAYMEQSGAWVAGERSGEFVIAPDVHDGVAGSIHLFVRNRPIDNRVTLGAGPWREELTMRPGEERMVDIPIPRGRSAVPLRVTSARGARPTTFEPGSTDTRFLGCWIETR